MSESIQGSDATRPFRMLVQKVVDDKLTAEESRELAEELQKSDAAKAYYLRYIQTHVELMQRWGGVELPQLPGGDLGFDNFDSSDVSSAGAPPIAPASQKNSGSRGANRSFNRTFQALACAAAVCLAVGVYWWMAFVADSRSAVQPGMASNRSVESDPSAPAPLPTDEVFVEQASPTGLPKVAAVIVNSKNTTKPGLAVGRRLRPGTLTLDQGTVQLEFMSGAIVAISGPAELQIESKDYATLMSGAVRANIPERARGFVLNAPNTAVVDLGTEFTLRVDQGKPPEVDVVEGEVELSLLADDGTTLVSQRLQEGASVRVDRTSSSLVTNGSDTSAAPRPLADDGPKVPESIVPLLLLGDDSGLTVSQRYVDMVKRQQPLLYWRFEQSQDNLVKNEVHDQWAAEIVGSDAENRLITIRNGYVQFRRGETSRYLGSNDPLVGINQGPYTIECWLNPDDLQHATCLGLLPTWDRRGHDYLNVFEILTDTFLIHEPGAFRFLHRNPPAKSYAKGTNLISPGICVPSVWQHLVMIKGDRHLAMYFNGRLVKQIDVENANGSGEFQLLVGQLSFDGWRQYAGGIDELALYPRQLTEDEIRTHYQTMLDDNRAKFAPLSL